MVKSREASFRLLPPRNLGASGSVALLVPRAGRGVSMSEATDSTDRLAAFLLGLPSAPAGQAASARRPVASAEAVLGDAGEGGERLVAHLRLLVATALGVVQIVLGASGGREVA